MLPIANVATKDETAPGQSMAHPFPPQSPPTQPPTCITRRNALCNAGVLDAKTLLIVFRWYGPNLYCSRYRNSANLASPRSSRSAGGAPRGSSFLSGGAKNSSGFRASVRRRMGTSSKCSFSVILSRYANSSARLILLTARGPGFLLAGVDAAGALSRVAGGAGGPVEAPLLRFRAGVGAAGVG